MSRKRMGRDELEQRLKIAEAVATLALRDLATKANEPGEFLVDYLSRTEKAARASAGGKAAATVVAGEINVIRGKALTFLNNTDLRLRKADNAERA